MSTPDEDMKRCTRCGEMKPLEEFHRNAKHPTGRASHCRLCDYKRKKARRQAEPELVRKQGRESNRRHQERLYGRGRELRAEARAHVLAHYGNVCACCGSTEGLEIDHVNGDGGTHRRELFPGGSGTGAMFYRWLIRNDFPPGYQLLCITCNRSKGRRDHCMRHPKEDAVERP